MKRTKKHFVTCFSCKHSGVFTYTGGDKIDSQYCAYCNTLWERIHLGKYFVILCIFYGSWTEIETDIIQKFLIKCSVPADWHNAWHWFKGRNIYAAWNCKSPRKVLIGKNINSLIEQVEKTNIHGRINFS